MKTLMLMILLAHAAVAGAQVDSFHLKVGFNLAYEDLGFLIGMQVINDSLPPFSQAIKNTNRQQRLGKMQLNSKVKIDNIDVWDVVLLSLRLKSVRGNMSDARFYRIQNALYAAIGAGKVYLVKQLNNQQKDFKAIEVQAMQRGFNKIAGIKDD